MQALKFKVDGTLYECSVPEKKLYELREVDLASLSASERSSITAEFGKASHAYEMQHMGDDLTAMRDVLKDILALKDLNLMVKNPGEVKK